MRGRESERRELRESATPPPPEINFYMLCIARLAQHSNLTEKNNEDKENILLLLGVSPLCNARLAQHSKPSVISSLHAGVFVWVAGFRGEV